MKVFGKAVVVTAAAIALLVVGAVGMFGGSRAEPPAPVPQGQVDALASKPLVGARTLEDTIAALQARVRRLPRDAEAAAALALAYIQQARITGDPSSYPQAESMLRRSLDLDPTGNLAAITGSGALALARHEFEAARAWGERGKSLDRHDSSIRGVLVDALIELGRYDEAFDELQQMVDLRPDLASYARVSYARELEGDSGGAVGAMELALGAAGTAADRAWAYHQLGDLHFNEGNLDPAEQAYRLALASDPSFIPPVAGLGRVAAARGKIRDAITRFERVVASFPAPEHVAVLGDLYARAGEQERARQQYELVEVEERLLRANGVDADLESALFHADHRVDLGRGLAAGRAAWESRKSVHAADALAWILHAAGRHREALGYANEALRLGTRDASFLFHRASIEMALGMRDEARRDLRAALDVNPHFSVLWSSEAAELLEQLEVPR